MNAPIAFKIRTGEPLIPVSFLEMVWISWKMSASVLRYPVENFYNSRKSIEINKESFGNPGNLFNGSGGYPVDDTVVFGYPVKALFRSCIQLNSK